MLRYYGPWLAAVAVAVLALTAYLDLRARVQDLEANAGTVAAPALEPEPTDASAVDAGAIGVGSESGSTAPVVTRGAAPAWTCMGSIPEEAVRASIGRHGPAVLRCYDQRARQVPDLAGTLLVRVRVAPTGGVGGVYVSGIEDPELVSCVGNAAIQWRFPPVSDGECAVVEAPFSLGAH